MIYILRVKQFISMATPLPTSGPLFFFFSKSIHHILIYHSFRVILEFANKETELVVFVHEELHMKGAEGNSHVVP